ncbi:serine hydrolase domain-containing protein [Nonomuraea sp. NPDC001636]|uniref:serine hydrolase domain-containing protein n=1 Tax=Nonomuraea sp. NPDC001636 TaxID=3154391 RepID=UPI003329A6CD
MSGAGSAGPSRRTTLGLLGAVPLAVGGGLTPAEDGVAAYDRYLRSLAEQDQFSGTALLARRGRPVLARSYGMADKERSIRNGTDTVYCLASASKPFTGLAVVQLAQQGRLRFYEKLGAYLDGFPDEVARHVTVHQLLTHSSGLPDFTVQDPDDVKVVTHSVEEQTRFVRTRTRLLKPVYTPGTDKTYSSSGYEILGELVATLSGLPFHEYVRRNIFVPAGMTRSAYYTRTDWLNDARIAHPYIYQSDGSRVDGVRHLEAGAVLNGGPGTNAARAFIGSGGGSGFSTAPDLVRFALALQRDKLLNHAYTQLYLSPKVSGPPLPGPGPAPATEAFQAYGPVAGITGDQRHISHGGGIAGGNTNWSIYLDSDWVGVILCNYDLDIQAIIRQERKAVLGA